MSKTKSDPTGQSRNRKRANRSLTVRLNRAESRVKSLFRRVPRKRRTKVKIVNAESLVVYDYDLSPDDSELLATSIDRILNNELLESQNQMPIDWYWKDIVEPPYREGALEETNNFNQLIVAAGITGILIGGAKPRVIEPEQILFSQPYQQGLQQVYSNGFNQIKTLSERTASQVMTQINLGIEAGKTPTEISTLISERFDVSRTSAERIAVTEVNKVYNDSKMATTDLISEQTGLRAGVIHISALLSTTREPHAARHGKAYTTDQQRQWWNTGVNRINCHCGTISVLIDRNGKVVDQEKQQEIKTEGKEFFDS